MKKSLVRFYYVHIFLLLFCHFILSLFFAINLSITTKKTIFRYYLTSAGCMYEYNDFYTNSIDYIYIYLYKYENVCVSVCLSVRMLYATVLITQTCRSTVRFIRCTAWCHKKNFLKFYCFRTHSGPKSNFVPKGFPNGFQMAEKNANKQTDTQTDRHTDIFVFI